MLQMWPYLKETRQSSSLRSSISDPFYQGGHGDFHLFLILIGLPHQHTSVGSNDYGLLNHSTHQRDIPHSSVPKKDFIYAENELVFKRFTGQTMLHSNLEANTIMEW